MQFYLEQQVSRVEFEDCAAKNQEIKSEIKEEEVNIDQSCTKYSEMETSMTNPHKQTMIIIENILNSDAKNCETKP